MKMKDLVSKMTMKKTAAKIVPVIPEIEEILLRARELVGRHANSLPSMEQADREAYERLMIPNVFNAMSPKIFPDLQLKPYETAKTISGTVSDYSSALKNLTDAAKNVIDIKTPKQRYSAVGEAIKQYTVPAVMGIGALGIAGDVIFSPAVQAHQMYQSYSNLKKENPALENLTDDQLKKYFGLVAQYSPETAANPLAAGAVINKIHQFEGVDPKLISELASIHKAYSERSPLSAAIESGTSYMSGK